MDAEMLRIPLSESFALPDMVIFPNVTVGGYEGYMILIEGGTVSFWDGRFLVVAFLIVSEIKGAIIISVSSANDTVNVIK